MGQRENERGHDDVVIIHDRVGVDVDVKVREEHGHDVIEVDIVDVEKCGREGKVPPPAKRYKVRIDRDYHVFDKRIVTARELLERAGKVPVERFEIEMGMHCAGFVNLEPGQKIDLGQPGIEVFQTFPLDEQEG